jgi:hypothetical protein
LRIRLLDLGAVADRLPEDAVLVAQAVTDCRVLQRGEGVDEARRQSSETSIAEPCVGFLLNQRVEVPVLMLQGLPHERLRGQVHQVVAQGATEQELHRLVMNALRIGLFARALCLDPAMGDQVTDEAARRLELLSRLRASRVDQVLAEQVTLGPLLLLACQPQSLETALERGIEVPRALGR